MLLFLNDWIHIGFDSLDMKMCIICKLEMGPMVKWLAPCNEPGSVPGLWDTAGIWVHYLCGSATSAARNIKQGYRLCTHAFDIIYIRPWHILGKKSTIWRFFLPNGKPKFGNNIKSFLLTGCYVIVWVQNAKGRLSSSLCVGVRLFVCLCTFVGRKKNTKVLRIYSVIYQVFRYESLFLTLRKFQSLFKRK